VGVEVPAVQGEETVVVATRADDEPLAGATVRVFYRPDLLGEHEQAIGITDGRGRIAWTPSDAGIARLQAADQVQALQVAPRSPPEGTIGLLVTVAAMSLLLAGYGAWRPGAR
jgi:hypothetical protein